MMTMSQRLVCVYDFYCGASTFSVANWGARHDLLVVIVTWGSVFFFLISFVWISSKLKCRQLYFELITIKPAIIYCSIRLHLKLFISPVRSIHKRTYFFSFWVLLNLSFKIDCVLLTIFEQKINHWHVQELCPKQLFRNCLKTLSIHFNVFVYPWRHIPATLSHLCWTKWTAFITNYSKIKIEIEILIYKHFEFWYANGQL